MRDALGEAVDISDLFPTQQYVAEAAVGVAIGKLIQRNGLSGVKKRPPYPRRGPPNYWHSKTGRDLSGWREEARNNGGFLSRSSAR
jgi:hypothetical protein